MLIDHIYFVIIFLDVLGYLQEIESLSETIHNKVQTSKTNLRKIQSVCSRWACSEPMLDDESLPLDLSTIESTEQLVTERLHKKVNDDAVKLYSLLEVGLYFQVAIKLVHIIISFIHKTEFLIDK